MYTQLSIDPEYAVIYRDHHHALLLKMDLDAEAPNILGADQHCTYANNQPTASMTTQDLAIGDRLRVTRIQSINENWAIPMCTNKNAVHWHESAPPKVEGKAVSTEACVTRQVDRTARLAFVRTIDGGKLRSRQRFFDPFEKRKRNLPGKTAIADTELCCLVRATFAKTPAGSRTHSNIKCHVPAEYEGKLTHYVLTGEDTYFVATQQPVYEPVSITELADSELRELTKLLASPAASTEDATLGKLLTAVAALVKCCADREWRQGDHPSILSVGKLFQTYNCTRHQT